MLQVLLETFQSRTVKILHEACKCLWWTLLRCHPGFVFPMEQCLLQLSSTITSLHESVAIFRSWFSEWCDCIVIFDRIKEIFFLSFMYDFDMTCYGIKGLCIVPRNRAVVFSSLLNIVTSNWSISNRFPWGGWTNLNIIEASSTSIQCRLVFFVVFAVTMFCHTGWSEFGGELWWLLQGRDGIRDSLENKFILESVLETVLESFLETVLESVLESFLETVLESVFKSKLMGPPFREKWIFIFFELKIVIFTFFPNLELT